MRLSACVMIFRKQPGSALCYSPFRRDLNAICGNGLANTPNANNIGNFFLLLMLLLKVNLWYNILC